MSTSVLPSNEQRRLLERATLSYMENVEAAEEYLAGRGIDLRAARIAGLGVADKTVLEYKDFAGRLAIPYFTPAGPVNMVFRCIRDHDCKSQSEHGKYVRAPGLGVNLYGVQSYRYATSYMCITEGELDALSLGIMGIPAIAVPGAENWKDHWNLVFQDFESIFVFEDGDAAGKKFGLRVAKELGATRMKMPEREDVNSMMVKQGYPYFKKILEL
jgi:DNA primase